MDTFEFIKPFYECTTDVYIRSAKSTDMVLAVTQHVGEDSDVEKTIVISLYDKIYYYARDQQHDQQEDRKEDEYIILRCKASNLQTLLRRRMEEPDKWRPRMANGTAHRLTTKEVFDAFSNPRLYSYRQLSNRVGFNALRIRD
jgi:hypothetical protein